MVKSLVIAVCMKNILQGFAIGRIEDEAGAFSGRDSQKRFTG
jgi:hypothetical protein